MKNGKDHLTRAAKTVLRPLLERHGFQMFTPRTFVRLEGKIAQYLCLHKSAWGGEDFCVDYFIFILIPPREFVGSILAGRFPRAKSGEGWWESKTEELAHAAMLEVCERYESFGSSVFESTRSLSGYVGQLKQRGAHLENAHFDADIGCALLCDGKISDATTYLNLAEKRYLAFTVNNKPVDWSVKAAQHMRQLLNAIQGDTHKQLVEEWFSRSIELLGINKKWKR
jgi:hypothetical protein